MSTYILITTENYDGQMAEITFYPSSGGSIYLGSVLLPYEYYTDDFYGTLHQHLQKHQQILRQILRQIPRQIL